MMTVPVGNIPSVQLFPMSLIVWWVMNLGKGLWTEVKATHQYTHTSTYMYIHTNPNCINPGWEALTQVHSGR